MPLLTKEFVNLYIVTKCYYPIISEANAFIYRFFLHGLRRSQLIYCLNIIRQQDAAYTSTAEIFFTQ